MSIEDEEGSRTAPEDEPQDEETGVPLVPNSMDVINLVGEEDSEISEAKLMKEPPAPIESHIHPPASAADLQNTWSAVTAAFPSQRMAGRNLVERIKFAAPDTISFFRKNSTAMGCHVWSTLTRLVMSYDKPNVFRVIVQEIALRHLGTPMTELHVRIFRDALIGHCAEAVGDDGLEALADMLSPMIVDIGVACMKMRTECSGNVELVISSWEMIRKQESKDVIIDVERNFTPEHVKQAAPEMHGACDKNDELLSDNRSDSTIGEKGGNTKSNFENVMVPKTFREMLMFNAVVMQLGNRQWLPVLMEAMDGLATSISRPARFQEECEVLALQLARFPGYNIDEFRTVMLASLRSLLSSSMDAGVEHAWSWFWQLVKQKLAEISPHKVKVQSTAWKTFIRQLPEDKLETLKIVVFESFFHSCEEAHEYLKVSNSKLSFIMQRILDMIGTLYDNSLAAVKDLSALGLTHAGWGVKPELLPLLIDAAMGVIKEEMHDGSLVQGTWWSMDLIARILDRTLLEGSTDVMRAIALNCSKKLRKAVARTRRGSRAQGLLNIRVGTESISPLLWAVETNALSTASAILADLLAIRADRVAYYYGMDALFARHPDIVDVLCAKAPALLLQLFDGLMWRSSKTENGQRRVNYYIRHVLVDAENNMKPSFGALVGLNNPELILHPLATFMLNLLWQRCAFLFFLTKIWFLFTFIDFIVGQQYGILMFDSESEGRWGLIACRLVMYIFTFGQLLVKHSRFMVQSIRRKNFVRVFGIIPVPQFLAESRQNCIEVLLCIFLMLLLVWEPFLHCLRVSPRWITNCCRYDEWYCTLSDSYDRLSSIPQVLYFMLFADMLHLNLYLSTFFVIFTRLFKDFLTYIGALVFITIVFASGISCLPQTGDVQLKYFYNFPSSFKSLIRMPLNFYGNEEAIASGPQDLATYVFLYRIAAQMMLLNTMIAQLVNSFSAANAGAFGQACLLRGFNIIHIAMPLMSSKKWRSWVADFHMDQPTELDPGEFGPSGGIQVMESAFGNAHLVVDRVRRFGGLTSPSLPWPEEHCTEDKDSEVTGLRELIEERMASLGQLMDGKRKTGSGSKTGSSKQASDTGSHLTSQFDQ